MNKQSIQRQGIRNARYSAGVANIIIPSDQKRDLFIQKCVRSSTVGILTDNGDYMFNIYCNTTILSHLQFPTDSSELGSKVVWINIPKDNIPVVIAILDDITCLTKEGQFCIQKTNAIGNSHISGDDLGNIVIDASYQADGDNGTLTINVNNKDETAELKIECNGNTSFVTLKQHSIQAGEYLQLMVYDHTNDELGVNIEYKLGEGLTIKDQYDNEITTRENEVKLTNSQASITLSEDKVVVESGEVRIGSDNAAHPLVKGDTLKTQLDREVARIDAILRAFQQAAVAPTDGGATLKANLIALTTGLLKGSYSEINSDSSYIQK